MALLAFGGLHTDAIENLKTMVPKRLEKNAKLRAELAAGFEQSGGTSLPIDHVRLEQLFEMIARGLAFYHWQIILGQGHSAIASIFADDGIDFFARMFDGWNAPKGVAENLGQGTFCYAGKQARDCPQATIWRFSMYGGIRFGGDARLPNITASLAVAVTGPNAFIEKLLSKTLERDIRLRAYELFEQRGREHGHDVDDWLQAEKELTSQRKVIRCLNWGIDGVRFVRELYRRVHGLISVDSSCEPQALAVPRT